MRSILLSFLLLPFLSFSQTIVANFSATPVSGCVPLTVNFTDQSTGGPTSWRWDFGNGSTSLSQNPGITYFSAGTYNVKLVVKNAASTDSIIKNQYIQVGLPPVPDFTGTPVTGCSPLPVQFTDNSAPGSGTISGWLWDFGDGNSSTLQNPVHTYTGSGIFTVTQWVTSTAGCAKIISKPSYINLSQVTVAGFNFTVAQGCSLPYSVTFNNTSTGPVTSSSWNFGDGTTSTQTNPVHIYQTAGVYTVKLVVSNANGCADTLIKTNAVNIQSATANFSSPATLCAGSAVTFTNTSIPNTVSASWNFGDGTTSNDINPSKVFTAAGTYQVKLVNNFGGCLDSITKSIVVNENPIPVFTATNNIDCRVPLTVSFNNTSIGAVTYIWNFGDGDTSTLQNPTHTYTQPGDFTVTLTATAATGCVATSTQTNIVQIHPPEIVSFNGLPAEGCLPYTLNPSAVIQSNQPITSYLWNFGDGGTSSLANPSYTYTTQGSFRVTLIITNAQGCVDTFFVNDAVRVGFQPTAAFSANPLRSCAGQTIQFTDQSLGNITEWHWDFGDSTFSTSPNPTHEYFDTGWHYVSLYIKSFGCSDFIEKVKYIYIDPPVANFDTLFFCNSRLSRQFLDKSISPQTWLWDFGDGSTATQPSPSHTYAAGGNYNVKLTVTNGACTHSTIKPIKVIDEHGQLNVNTPEICKGLPVVFNINNVDASNILQYTWYFSGIGSPSELTSGGIPVSFVYPATGSNLPVVITKDLLGCIDTLRLASPVKVYGPAANFKLPPAGVCSGTTVNFIDSSATDGVHAINTWLWNFGDGTSQSYTAPPFQHTYNTTGLFGAGLTVTDNFGCTSTLYKPDIINVAITGANFMSPDTLSCPGAPVSFVNQSTGINLTYTWDFGDGNTSTLPNPLHTYTNAGNYTVRLIAANAGICGDTLTKANFIKVSSPVARFSATDTFICQPIQILFKDSSSYATSWNWSFGNGNTSILQNPVNVFSTSQPYRVKLVVTSPGGCQDSAFKIITVDLLTATLSYTPLVSCAPSTITFTANSSRNVEYIWNFGDGNSVTTSNPATTNIFYSPGRFLPQILLRDVRGCIVPVNGNDSLLVEKVVPKFSVNQTFLCDSAIVQFSDSSTALGNLSYRWFFGDGGTSTLKNPAHNYTRTGVYSVKLIVTSSISGCSDSVLYQNFITVTATVAPAVTVSASASAICAGQTITFTATAVNGGTTPAYQWKINGVNAGTNSPVFSVSTLANNDSVSVELRSSLQCITTPAANSNSLKITVNPNLTPAITITTPATDICIRYSATFTAQPLNGGVNPIYQWKINGANVGTNSNTYTSSTLSNGDVVTCVLTSSETCTTSPTAVSNAIRMSVYNYPVADAGPDFIVLDGGQVVLSPRITSTTVRYRWSPPLYLSSDTIAKPVSKPLADINYKLTVTGIGGCASSDSMFVKVTKLIIPNVFSPNGDGINDKWIISNLYLFADATVDIFNRYGQLVFSRRGYENPWDGTYNGSPLPVAVYYYVISIPSQGIKPFGGSVTILK